MPKTIFFLRHAKSDWAADFSNDHERPLAKRGKKSAHVMGRMLAKSGQIPQRIYSSTAVRAHQTIDLACQAGKWSSILELSPQLYEADLSSLLQCIKKFPDNEQSVMLVGHEPTWSEAVSQLIGGGTIRMPTAAVARLDFACQSWEEVDWGSGVLIWLLQPKFFLKGHFTKEA